MTDLEDAARRLERTRTLWRAIEQAKSDLTTARTEWQAKKRALADAEAALRTHLETDCRPLGPLFEPPAVPPPVPLTTPAGVAGAILDGESEDGVSLNGTQPAADALLSLPRAGSANLCPVSFVHPAHDLCDGSPSPSRGVSDDALLSMPRTEIPLSMCDLGETSEDGEDDGEPELPACFVCRRKASRSPCFVCKEAAYMGKVEVPGASAPLKVWADIKAGRGWVHCLFGSLGNWHIGDLPSNEYAPDVGAIESAIAEQLGLSVHIRDWGADYEMHVLFIDRVHRAVVTVTKPGDEAPRKKRGKK